MYLPERSISQVWARNIEPTRSYPHTRVTGYEPPRSYHHVFTTIHEPTHSWHSISWSKFASMRINNTQSPYLQQYRLAQPKRRQANLLCKPPSRTSSPPGATPLTDPLLQGLWPGGAHITPSATLCRNLLLLLSLGAHTQVARRYTSSKIQLVFST